METTVALYTLIMIIMVATTAMIPSSTYSPNKKKMLRYWLIASVPIIIYTLFWGLRYEVGTDYTRYVRWFYESDIKEFSDDYLYILLNWTLRNAGFSEVSEFVVTSFLCILPIFIFTYHNNRAFACFAVLFFFLTGAVFFAQNGIRQALSLSILSISVLFLEKRKIVGALIVFVIAFLIHKSAIFTIMLLTILYFVPYYKANKYIILVVYVAFEIMGHMFQTEIMNYKGVIVFLGFEDQIENALWRIEESVSYNSGLGRILRMILTSAVILYQDKLLTREKDRVYYFWCLFIVGILLARVFSGNIILERVSKSFTLLDFFTYSFVCSYIVNKKKQKMNLATIIPILLIIGFSLTFVIAILNGSNGVSPYQMVR